ncbi:MAG: O-antigen ligase family protein [Bacteroidetes bacterium]|nr:O-antigen ligase family protein [Bacteroidota bacterium]
MIQGTFFKQLVRANYIFGLAVMIIFLPHSKIMLSLAQFWLAGTFVMTRYDTGRWLEFFRKNPLWKCITLSLPFSFSLLLTSTWKGIRCFINNRPAMIFSSILVLHVVGVIFTTDYNYALKDLRTKLPLFLLPLFISTAAPFNRRYFNGFMLLFAATVLVRTLINSWNLFGGHFIDIRQISRSISHILVALNISLVVFVLGYYLFRRRMLPSVILKTVFGIVVAWLLVYLILARSATGITITGLTLFILVGILLFRSRKPWLKVILTAFLLISVAVTGIYIYRIVKDYYHVNPVDITKLEKVSPRGNPYEHNTENKLAENGTYVYIYIQNDEMMEVWKRRSAIPFHGRDMKNQEIVNTLVRFLASKGLRKDADGVNALSDEEVRAVEKGIANVVFTEKFSIRGQVYELLWGIDEYRKTGDPTGSSLMQRYEFWKASLGLIEDNWLIGVGTGDMNEAFQQEYEKMNSKLAPDQRWRSHNQFLSIFVAFGIFGLLWFLFAILYPPLALGKFRDFFFLVFFIIAMLSMIPEDTIESQFGVTFFALFYSLFLFGKKEEDRI